jgi:hypothetical protein
VTATRRWLRDVIPAGRVAGCERRSQPAAA